MNIGRRAVPFDPFSAIAKLEKTSPKLARFITIHFLSVLSPFNAHLGSKLLEWTDEKCVIAVKRRRGVRNHVKSIHAGALFTLGETCAGLVIIRNFPFARYRPLMSDVSVNYSKQARGNVTGECIIPKETIAHMMAEVARGEVPFVKVVTNIRNNQNEIIAVVTTTWQVKQWQMVRTNSGS